MCPSSLVKVSGEIFERTYWVEEDMIKTEKRWNIITKSCELDVSDAGIIWYTNENFYSILFIVMPVA